MTAQACEDLLFIWTDPANRRRNVVGCLQKWPARYTFRYAKSLPSTAGTKFWAFPAFPDITRVYESQELFPAFARRLPDSSRTDFGKFLSAFGLKPPVSSWDLLKVSGGRLATDTFEFAIPLQRNDDQIAFDFYVAGWQYHGAHVDPQEYAESARLNIAPEVSNPHDPHAFSVMTTQGHKLGYVPAFYAETLARLHASVEGRVVTFNPEAGPRGALFVRLTGKLPPSAHAETLVDCFCK
ncbi:MAG TPA: HIRAN domain-containing protein [Symbiobacteriaceae bacterium]|jgi:hypothetical protein